MRTGVAPSGEGGGGRARRWPAAAALAVAVAVVAACGSAARPVSVPSTRPASPTTATTAPSASTTRPPASTTSFAVYFLRGSYLGVAHRTVPVTTAVGRAAVGALLGGPDLAERAAGLTSAVPAGSRLLGLSISGGTATADFNTAYATPGAPPSELQRVAQVVYTLTQFRTVSRVSFRIDGAVPATFAGGAVDLSRPLARSDVLGAVPAILVENPAVGDSLHGSLRLSGMANVYEAQFRVKLIDGAGRVLVDQPVHASAGTGTWGTFDVTFSFTATSTTLSTLRVFDESAKDGSPIDEVDLHLPAGP